MLNTKTTPTEAAPRFNFAPKSGEIKSHTGIRYELDLASAIEEFIGELPNDWNPSDVSLILSDLRNTFLRAKHDEDMSVMRFQKYIAVMDIAEHFFVHLIRKKNNE